MTGLLQTIVRIKQHILPARTTQRHASAGVVLFKAGMCVAKACLPRLDRGCYIRHHTLSQRLQAGKPTPTPLFWIKWAAEQKPQMDGETLDCSHAPEHATSPRAPHIIFCSGLGSCMVVCFAAWALVLSV